MKASFLWRMSTAVLLGVLSGILCTYLASSSNPTIWGTPLMWVLIANRATIGFVIGIVGVYTTHPFFGFHVPSYLRGAIFGAIISIELAAGVFMTPAVGPMSQVALFWMTILAGTFYGSVIDIIASKVGGQGSELLKK